MGLFSYLFGGKTAKDDETQNQMGSDNNEERLKAEHARRQRLIEGQKEREDDAKETRVFTKNQRCFYFHKPSETWLDSAHVVGVHSEDDPSNPYYTIRYIPPGIEELVEKQTTRDRIAYIEWSPDLTWKILSPDKNSPQH